MKILVIEDDEDVRDSLRLTLEDEHFVVDTAEDGEVGLYRAREWKYDLIVLDVMLPELDGWGVLEALRSAKVPTPVLMLTALDSLDDRVKGLNQGADDYLAKPFSERELLARIRALHRRSVGQASDVLEFGDVAVRTSERRVERKGAPVELTAAQYRIVEYLALRAGKVVPGGELAEAITGEDESAMSNVIEVQIHHIRRKLGKAFIQNRRGLGYLVPRPESRS